ncbi:hypothetical protein Trydic_g620 [Trypoxylus dichotomus]
MPIPFCRQLLPCGRCYRHAHDIPLHNTDLQDIVVMRNVAQLHQCTVLNALSSDYSPVLLQLGQATRGNEEHPPQHTVSWSAFTDHLSNDIGPITAIDGSIQLETAEEKPRNPYQIPSDTQQTSHTPSTPEDSSQGSQRSDTAEYNPLARRTKATLNEFHNLLWNNFIIQASESSSAFWKAAKIIKKQRSPLPPIRGARGVASPEPSNSNAVPSRRIRTSTTYDAFIRECDTFSLRRKTKTIYDQHCPKRGRIKAFRPDKASGPRLKAYPRKFIMYDKHMQRHASLATLFIPVDANGHGHDPQALAVRHLAAEILPHQSSPSHE